MFARLSVCTCAQASFLMTPLNDTTIYVEFAVKTGFSFLFLDISPFIMFSHYMRILSDHLALNRLKQEYYETAEERNAAVAADERLNVYSR